MKEAYMNTICEAHQTADLGGDSTVEQEPTSGGQHEPRSIAGWFPYSNPPFGIEPSCAELDGVASVSDDPQVDLVAVLAVFVDENEFAVC
jgi:hypothetical protein